MVRAAYPLDSSVTVQPRRVGIRASIASIDWCGPHKNELWVLTTRGTLSRIGRSLHAIGEIEGDAFRQSPDGLRIASFQDRNLWVWSTSQLALIEDFSFLDSIDRVTWSPNSDRLAVSFSNGEIDVLSTRNPFGEDALEHLWSYTFADAPEALANGGWEWVAAAVCWTDNNTIIHTHNGVNLVKSNIGDARDIGHILDVHGDYEMTEIVALPSGRILTAGIDATIRVHDESLMTTHVYESPSGHPIFGLSGQSLNGLEAACAISGDGSLLVLPSVSSDDVIHVQTNVPDMLGDATFGGFSHDGKHIALASPVREQVNLWNTKTILSKHRENTAQYKNAKIVLVGDTGVGKSGLALALSGGEFHATESTHGRSVITLARETLDDASGQSEVREVHLWDLAGQPGYRVFHQLSLREVSVGAVVFDARSETDPFRGVNYWTQALAAAARDQSAHMSKVLVAARIDRGILGVSQERIHDFASKHSFEEFLQTSAKTGDGIASLRREIIDRIDWSSIAAVVAPKVFVEVRRYLISLKESHMLIASEEELRDQFAQTGQTVSTRVFEVCLQRLETAGVITKMSIGDKWLLQPELLDNYVAWLSQAARSEPDGLGSILEGDALAGEYQHDRLPGAADEALMLLAAVQEVVARGIALRVPTDRGQMLTFPSELRQDIENYPGEYDREIKITFAGPIASIYAALTVRLLNSLMFGGYYRLYRTAALFSSAPGAAREVSHNNHVCGYVIRYPDNEDESLGELEVFFSPKIAQDRKLAFLRYVDYQLRQMALKDSIKRRRLYRHCGIDIANDAVEARRKLGYRSALCAVCGSDMPFDDLVEGSLVSDKTSRSMQYHAIAHQERQRRLISMPTRFEQRDFDSFLCYNTVDAPEASVLRNTLMNEGITVWMDVRSSKDRPIEEIDEVLSSVPTAIIALGPNTVGVWQEHEYYAILSQAILGSDERARLAVIPVLLPGAPNIRELPPMLRPYHVIDLRGPAASEGYSELISMITRHTS